MSGCITERELVELATGDGTGAMRAHLAACDPCATQYCPQMEASFGGYCAGGAMMMAAPSCPGGCATTIPGQTMVMPGQTVVTPNSTLAPTPVPTLQP